MTFGTQAVDPNRPFETFGGLRNNTDGGNKSES